MKIELKDYQETAASQLVTQIRAVSAAGVSNKHAFVLTAPTGSGKTAIMTSVMERLIGGDELRAADSRATFLWVTDAPELNEQSKKKIVMTSEVFTPQRVETIGASFDQRTFDSGRVYFLNTQKLGQSTNYTRKTDRRTYTLWDTISRTARERADSFFLVLDEAHKGVGRRRSEIVEATTIVQRLILGSPGFTSPSLLIGMSATPARFNDLLETSTDRVRWPMTQISADDVRESGLLKDQIILWHTKRNGRTDWALLRESAAKLHQYEKGWSKFCDKNGRERIRPILVVQVGDASGRKVSNTDLGLALNEIEKVLGKLPGASVAHAFQEPRSVPFALGRSVRKVAPSDIQDDEHLRVVFFKMALNTGWDCPRAEVMMSFRRAVDYTHIAQLVGRMVRTPLAERVAGDDFLNSVALYLPNWDEEALERVIHHLTTSDDGVPSTIERGESLRTYARAKGSKALFDTLAVLPTYPAVRANKSSNVKRLMQLARYLANDDVAPSALNDAHALIFAILDASRRRLKARMARLVEAIQRADLVETRITLGGTASEASGPVEASVRSIELVEQNIRDLFADAGGGLGPVSTWTMSSGVP